MNVDDIYRTMGDCCGRAAINDFNKYSRMTSSVMSLIVDRCASGFDFSVAPGHLLGFPYRYHQSAFTIERIGQPHRMKRMEGNSL